MPWATTRIPRPEFRLADVVQIGRRSQCRELVEVERMIVFLKVLVKEVGIGVVLDLCSRYLEQLA